MGGSEGRPSWGWDRRLRMLPEEPLPDGAPVGERGAGSVTASARTSA